MIDRCHVNRRQLLAAGLASFAVPRLASAQTGRGAQATRAVVIAQSYRDTPRLFLPNTVPDGLLVEQTLRRLNFDQVLLLQDQPAQETIAALGAFLTSIRPADLAIAYVAGHGVEIGDENLLMLNGGDRYLSLQTLMEALQDRTGTVLVFIDACRSNPYDPIAATAQVARAARAVEADAAAPPIVIETVGAERLRGAQSEEAGRLQPFTLVGSGIKVVFSTDPFNVALDGATSRSRNSPFAQALSRRLLERRSLDDVVALTTGDVLAATGNSQSPWAQGSIGRPLFLAGPPVQRNPSRPRFQVPG